MKRNTNLGEAAQAGKLTDAHVYLGADPYPAVLAVAKNATAVRVALKERFGIPHSAAARLAARLAEADSTLPVDIEEPYEANVGPYEQSMMVYLMNGARIRQWVAEALAHGDEGEAELYHTDYVDVADENRRVAEEAWLRSGN